MSECLALRNGIRNCYWHDATESGLRAILWFCDRLNGGFPKAEGVLLAGSGRPYLERRDQIALIDGDCVDREHMRRDAKNAALRFVRQTLQ